MASASAGVSAPSRGCAGATTRRVKIGGLGGALADRVEFLQRLDQRRVRVAAEPALRRADAGQDLLAGGGVGAAGAAPGEPVQRPVGPRRTRRSGG